MSPDTMLRDAPVSFTNPYTHAVWSPRNYKNEYMGDVTMRRALEHSLNTATVRLLEKTGVDNVIDLAKRLHISADFQPNLSLALGTTEISPLDMANAFIWGAALYVGLFQAAALSAKGAWFKRVSETFLALGTVLLFIFFYFYLDLRLGLAKNLASGAIGRPQYIKALGLGSFGSTFLKFLESPQNDFLIFGVATFGIFLLASKMIVLGLRSRIAWLFGAARADEKADDPTIATGQAATVTVISSDIKDFTGLADRLSPERSVAILNRYYSVWAVAADRNGGRIAGTTGDSVHLVFGLLGEKDAAERALACARDFIAELPGLQDDLLSASLPAPAEVSIGINSGSIVAGDLGVAESRRLGVFGEAVSVAARLDSLCREFKQDLLLSQSVFRQLELESQARLVRIGEVLLRNSTQPVPVYGTK